MERLLYSPYLRRVWYGKITLFSLFDGCRKIATILSIESVSDIRKERLHFFFLFKACWIRKDYTILPIEGVWYGNITLFPIQSVCDMERLHYSPYSRCVIWKDYTILPIQGVWYGKITLFYLLKVCVIWKDYTVLPVLFKTCVIWINCTILLFFFYGMCDVIYGTIILFSLSKVKMGTINFYLNSRSMW